MSKPVSQKREFCDENGVFNELWTMQFLFIESNGNPLCLVCQVNICREEIQPQTPL